MPDITMCVGENCPIKNICFRFTSKPDNYQSYFTEVPYDHTKDKCDHFGIDTNCNAEFVTLDTAKKFPWGTHGKSGKDPLRYISLGNADTEHLEAIAKQPHISENYSKAIKLILEDRQKSLKK